MASKEEKVEAFRLFNFDTNDDFKAFMRNVELPPGDRALVKVKAKWYKRHVDPDFDLEWLPALAPQTAATATPQPAAAAAAPPPPQQHAAASTGAGMPRNAGRSPQWQLSRQLHIAFLQGLALILALLYLQPLRPALSMWAFSKLMLVLLGCQALKLHTAHGLPAALRWEAIKQWLMRMLPTSDAQYFLLAFAAAGNKPVSAVLPPFLVLSAYGVMQFLSQTCTGHPLWQQHGAQLYRKMQTHQQAALHFNAQSEIMLGFVLAVGVLFPSRAPMFAFIVWQVLRMRFWSLDAAVYHRQVWANLGQLTLGVRQQFPILQKAVDLGVGYFHQGRGQQCSYSTPHTKVLSCDHGCECAASQGITKHDQCLKTFAWKWANGVSAARTCLQLLCRKLRMLLEQQPARLKCGLLLELPSDRWETCFWEDENTLRSYINWDKYICCNMIISNIIMVGTMWSALRDTSALRHTWHMHVSIGTNLVVCTAHLALILRRHDVYVKSRHSIVVMQRWLRMLFMLLAVLQSGHGLQAALAKSINKVSPDDPGPVELMSAVMNVCRPLLLAPGITMAHGSWVFATKSWLPFQLCTVLLAILGSGRHQHCRMAADPSSSQLLKAACTGISDLLGFLARCVFGGLWLPLDASSISATACSSKIMAARTLGVYAHALFGGFMPIVGFCALEWRVKARWCRRNLGLQLVYGPWGWPESIGGKRSFASLLHYVLTWMLVTVLGMWLLWVAVSWGAPRLPMVSGEDCEGLGASQSLAPCDAPYCSSPGHLVAAALYFQIIATLVGHLAVTHMM